MAICTFSGNLNWPWSSNVGLGRPASPLVDATPRLTTYRNILESSGISFYRLWSSSFDMVAGVCGHGMSVCTERQGRWPYGNDSSAFWQQTYTGARLQLYRNVYSGNLASARDWQNLRVFLPLCRNLMVQCVTASGESSSDAVVGVCGNQMAICTSENILWPHSYDASAAYMNLTTRD
ncbi:hypothetical protein BKA69DRAFT_1163892 [Paraphysoderma sedebokerense]|nr:hypothetical protein BKA69DRAFT_1163892 [Paraphysoderma sedebokerense]